MSTDDRQVITDARTMRALAHPVRVALLDALSRHGSLTATEAADLLGDSPGNMSWHLQTLAKYGFVEEAGGGRGRARPWRAISRITSFETSLEDPDTAAASDALEASYQERNIRSLREWWTHRRSYPAKWRKAAFSSNSFTYLTSAELTHLSEEINALILRYRDRVRDEESRPKGALPVRIVAYGHPVPGNTERPYGSSDRV
jgi:DNA-binding transcriptional ArsR family regulator